MWELLTHPSNIAFSISLCLMFLFGILEVLLAVIGGGSQSLVEQFLPEDLEKQSINGAPKKRSLIRKILDWLCLGHVPLFIWLIIFLSAFSFTGLMIQSMMHYFTDMLFNALLITLASFFLCMPLVRLCVQTVARLLPYDNLPILYSDALIGCTAVIVHGEARMNMPAKAKVQDQQGITHYVMVEPDQEVSLSTGSSLVLTQKTKNGFQGTLL
ncbi:OB-fold-containig protein [Acinetobacter tianfuensis]|uniref:DUF1449 family protein n=1 Tax=Acinetobacter tianfuensis TaxID=2419603 RepID=A0A3A8EVH5_9GAMM|nr:OB-fold-containig protein [Acinetobacter tianfuensis]RKG32851.1 DUF1449 family protein [Acinetobacter tianfuensis]